MKYLSNFFISIDQLGNVLAGGNPDNTISSRIGFYTQNPDENKIPIRWRFFRNIIDFTFYPIDGKNHCKESYFNDAGEDLDEGTSDFAVAFLAILIIPSCLLIVLLLYTLWIFGIVSPKEINRNKNIKHRLTIAEARLRGVLTELNSNKVIIDKELNEILDKTKDKLSQISKKTHGLLAVEKRLKSYKSNN